MIGKSANINWVFFVRVRSMLILMLCVGTLLSLYFYVVFVFLPFLSTLCDHMRIMRMHIIWPKLSDTVLMVEQYMVTHHR